MRMLGLTSIVLLSILGCSKPKESAAPVVSEDFLYLFLHPGVVENRANFAPQVKLAEEVGINRFTFYSSGYPLVPNPPAAAWEKSEALFSLFTETSKTAELAPRIALMANVGDAGLPASEGMKWKTAPTTFLCWASPQVQKAAQDAVRSIVEHYEASPFAERIWAYQVAAQETGEWIPHGYRSHGADYSEANTLAFRAWLAKKYQDDKSLCAAWGNDSVSLATATIPEDVDKRFPIRPPAADVTVQAFYELPREQDWVDYSEFGSDTTASIIRKLAAQVKQSSGKKVITFYGYVFELPGSICGHLKARDILRDENIDFLAAPISYAPYSQRLVGGVGGAMSAVDSMPLHDKTWVNEDDLHTHAEQDGAFVPKWYWDSSNPEFKVPANLAETEGILKRNLAFAAFHHASTWWMDLYGGGWYSDPGIWNIWKGEFGEAMRQVRPASLPYTPAVAVIVDEDSRLYEKFTWTFREMYPPLRNAVMGSGTTAGFFYLDDYLEGKVPPSTVTVFVNLWRLTPEKRQRLKELVNQRGGTVVWQYAPGFMNPDTGGGAGIEELTGIRVTVDAGRVGSIGVGALEGRKFGGNSLISPRVVISDEATVALARYSSDNAISAASKKSGGVNHVLVADYNWNADFVHALWTALGATPMSSAPALIQANANTLFVYATRDGSVTLRAPFETSFDKGALEMTLGLQKNQSHLLPLVPAKK